MGLYEIGSKGWVTVARIRSICTASGVQVADAG